MNQCSCPLEGLTGSDEVTWTMIASLLADLTAHKVDPSHLRPSQTEQARQTPP